MYMYFSSTRAGPLLLLSLTYTPWNLGSCTGMLNCPPWWADTGLECWYGTPLTPASVDSLALTALSPLALLPLQPMTELYGKRSISDN